MTRRMIALSLFIVTWLAAPPLQAQSCDLAPPMLLTPANNAAAVPSLVHFSWTAVSSAVEYKLLLQEGDGRASVFATTRAESVIRVLSPGHYRWKVVAVTGDCGAFESEQFSFTIQAATDCSTKPSPVAISPAGTELMSPEVTFSWQRAPGAVAHSVWLIPESGFPTRIATTTVANQVTEPVPFGQYAWFVAATFPGCASVRSAVARFSIQRPEGCVARRPPIILSPDRASTVVSPVQFAWSEVPQATGYRVYTVDRTGEIIPRSTVTGTQFSIDLAPGVIAWLVEAVFEDCPPSRSSISLFRVVDEIPCRLPDRPIIRAVRKAISDRTYVIRWTPSSQPNSVYTLLESTDPTFEDADQIATHRLTAPLFEALHAVDTPMAFYYAVRSENSCGEEGPFSRSHRVVVAPPRSIDDAAILDQSTSVEQPGVVAQQVQILRPDSIVDMFNVTVDVPWLSVSPSSGAIGAEPVTLTLLADGDDLDLGSNRAAVNVEFSSAGKTASSTSSTTIPLSVTLVTPVATTAGDEPSPDVLIIPAVAHADGFNSQWQSDVRVANATAQTLDVDLRFTQSAVDGTTAGDVTSVSIVSGQTLSLDDVLESFYGEGALGESVLGSLEVRPLGENVSTGLGNRLSTIVTSRTYNTTESGTFGQFIPAALYADFIGMATPSSSISLQHVAQSDAFRTNVGLVEGAGKESTVRFTVLDGSGATLGQFETVLMPREHRQISQILATEGLTVEDARIEIDLIAGEGKITAYASVVDNLTNDPRIVAPAYLPHPSSDRFVVPGVADLDTGTASWRTDMRIFNSGDSRVTGTLRFYPQGAPESPQEIELAVDAGTIVVLDNLLAEHFGATDTGGVVHVLPDAPASLVVTARTFNLTESGTYGQFIPSVTGEMSAGVGDPALQLLQVEQSARFRTNLGLAETTGGDARVRITAVVPGAIIAPTVEIDLRGNEFIQLVSILEQMGFSSAYNARLTVEAISGAGKVTAYASVVDNETQDPTYVPAQ